MYRFEKSEYDDAEEEHLLERLEKRENDKAERKC
jgi:hypothetical protein